MQSRGGGGRVIETSGSEVRSRLQRDAAGSSRHQRVAAGLGGAAIAVVVLVVLVYILVTRPGGPEVLIQQGATTGVPQGGAWAVGKGGTLQGSFIVANGSAEICFADYDMFSYSLAHGIGFNQCPSNAAYSSGFVASGVLSGSFGTGDIYLQTFVQPGWNGSQPRLSVTWTGPVEILPR